ncbi:MAG: hypothetical protein IPO48_09180 [Saprospiraceae bacterium]|nr:hypothetical protein [Saprospiraceae bacterium]
MNRELEIYPFNNGTDGAGNAVTRSTTTDESGLYAFNNLTPGSYTITLTLQAGYAHTKNDPSIDSNLNSDGINGVISNISLISGQTKNDQDFGLIRARNRRLCMGRLECQWCTRCK